MATMTHDRPAVNPAPRNPRDGWPAWTDESRWDLGPVAPSPEADEPRPTAGPDYDPSIEEEAEAAELLNGDDEPTDADWDRRAEEAYAMDRVCSGPIS